MINSLKSSTNDSDCDSPIDTSAIINTFQNNAKFSYQEESVIQMQVIKEERRESSNVNIIFDAFPQHGSSFNSVIQRSAQDFHGMESFLEKNIHYIIRLQAKIRCKLQQNKYKRLKKNAKYRKFVIQELIETELTYVNDLELIIKKIMNPIQQQQILDQDEFQTVFRNIQVISEFNSKFYKELKDNFDHYHPNIPFGKIFEKYVPFFKVYYEYCHNYQIDLISKLRSKYDQLNAIITQTEEEDMYRGLNLEAFLIKPVQRLPKYVLLIKDLFKHTWDFHPDFETLQSSLDDFLIVNKQIDSQIDKFLTNQTLFDLEQQFKGCNIVESSRRFIMTETLGLLVSNKTLAKSIIAYICNDLVIITKRKRSLKWNTQELKLLLLLPLDDQSFCKNISENSYYQYLFTLCTKTQSLTFACTDKEQKHKLVDLFQDLFQELIQAKRTSELRTLMKIPTIRVYAKGTQIKNQLFRSYTIYLMLIKINDTTLTVSVRYKTLTQLEQMVKREFPDMALPHLSTNQWRSCDSYIVEARKLLIENFLETLLNSEQVQQNPKTSEKILKFLELPISFYEMARKSASSFSEVQREEGQDQKKSKIMYQSKSLCIEDISSQGLREILTTDKMRGSIVNELRKTQHEKQLDYINSKNIKVYFADGASVTIPTTSELRVAELINYSASFKKLQFSLDFRLFLTDGKETRLLDEEDSFFQRNLQDRKSSLFQKLQIFFKEKEKIEHRLILKKYIYLSLESEKVEYEKDQVRLQLLCHQSLSDITQGFYLLPYKKYCRYAALYLLIKYPDISQRIFTTSSLPIQKAKEFLPDKIYKSQAEGIWNIDIFQYFQKYKLKEQKQPYAYLKFMKSISKQPIFGYSLFVVEQEISTKYFLNSKLGVDCQQHIFLSLSYKNLSFHRLNDKKLIKSFPLSEIKDLQFYAFHINFKVCQFDQKLQFKTTQGYEISKLYTLYCEIKE